MLIVTEEDGQACVNVTRSIGDPDTFGYRVVDAFFGDSASGTQLICAWAKSAVSLHGPSHSHTHVRVSFTVEFCSTALMSHSLSLRVHVSLIQRI